MPEILISGALTPLVASAATGIAGYVVGKMREARRKAEEREKAQDARRDALARGVGLLLRARLTELHAEYVVPGCGCPESVKREAQEVYGAYHALGLNGVGTHLYEEIMDAHVAYGKEQ